MVEDSNINDAVHDSLEGLGRLIAQSEFGDESDMDEESEIDSDYDIDDVTRALYLDEDGLEDEDEDEAEDEQDDEETCDEAPSNDTSAIVDSVFTTYFKSLQARLSRETLANEENQRKTFWIEPPSPYFSLRVRSRDPNPLYLPRVFVWRPHLRQNLKCRFCPGTLAVKGWNKNPYARRVADLDR
jgi:hypothetical protein